MRGRLCGYSRLTSRSIAMGRWTCPLHQWRRPGYHRPLLDQLRHVTALDPGQVALTDSTTRLTYGALWRLSCLLGARFATVGGSGPIAVALPDGPLYVAALLGCLAAGRISVPLDRHAPAARNAEITHDARVAAIVVPADEALDPIPDHPGPPRLRRRDRAHPWRCT